MTALEVAIEALEEIRDAGGPDYPFYLHVEIAKEALGKIRRAQYLEGQNPSGPDVMKEKL